MGIKKGMKIDNYTTHGGAYGELQFVDVELDGPEMATTRIANIYMKPVCTLIETNEMMAVLYMETRDHDRCILSGDLNAHIGGAMSWTARKRPNVCGREDNIGEAWAKHLEGRFLLANGNLTGDEKGRITYPMKWNMPHGSTVDYTFFTPSLKRQLLRMDFQKPVGSDHLGIILTYNQLVAPPLPSLMPGASGWSVNVYGKRRPEYLCLVCGRARRVIAAGNNCQLIEGCCLPPLA